MPRYFNLFGFRIGIGSRQDDVFVASARNDVFIGGRGIDTVTMTGSVRDAVIDTIGRGYARVTTESGGTDRLIGMELLEFDDYSVFLDGRNNAVLAEADTLSGQEDSAITGSFADLLANDFDYDGDTLTVTSVTSLSGGVVTLGADGYTFVPPENFNGDAVLQYTVTDGNGAISTATIAVSVAAVNDAPVAGDDTAEVVAGQETALDTATLLANDSDVDGDPLAIVGLADVVGGSADLIDGQIVFTADAGGDGTASLVYTVSDGQGGSDTGQIDFTVDPGVVVIDNLPPVALDATYTAGQFDPFVTLSVQEIIGGSFDPEDGSVQFVGIEGTSPFFQIMAAPGGDFMLFATGTPEAATYEYTIRDTEGLTDTGTISILTPGFGPPDGPGGGFADNDTFQFFSSSSNEPGDVFEFTVSDLLENDVDETGEGLRLVSIAPNEFGQGLPDFDGTTFSVAVSGGFQTSSFDYTVENSLGAQSTATVFVDEFYLAS